MRFSLYEKVLLAVFLGLFGLFALTAPNFLSETNLKSMMVQMPELGLISLGMMVVILTSGIDLSITYISSLSGIAVAWGLVQGWPVPLAIAAGACTALLCGLFNGFFIARIGVSPIVLTLGSMLLFEGLALRVTKGGSISGFPESYYVIGGSSVGPIPLPMLFFIAAAIVTSVLLNRTVWGRSAYMLGSNPTAALYSGIPVRRVLIYVYLFSALMALIAAVIMTSRYNSGKVDYGSSYLLLSVAAVVLGGTSVRGGSGTVKGTVIGVCIFQILSSALNLYGLSPHIVNVMMGGILIVVLVANYLSEHIKHALHDIGRVLTGKASASS
ncbi:ABC transporter permease [Paenibacillus cisolokensis]|uniref:ABC transporter permease n=1 Tax=Paenibacillus cisolokensis TaxID=1658519 RepID=A0ABQ4NEK5_9BACL|nr:ABC transporter permease [Paenibacillus cisolokensis]GIQ66606.1 ABC transporter permease [Paenibacillus cisolokensis]